MEWYKFGEPSGRYIGSFGNYDVYSESISENDLTAGKEKSEYRKIPGEFNFMYGPATGGLIESVGIKLATPGELIRDDRVYPDYKKRVLKLRGLSVEDALLVIERINGFHSASHSIAFLSAVEDAFGIKAEYEISQSRMLQMELERIRSNLEVLKRLCEPAGFGVPANQLGYLREVTSRIISDAAGHRFFFGVNGINSAKIDAGNISEEISALRIQFERVFESLQESKIFLNRLQNNGITKNLDLIGPAARAAGLKVDARLDSKTISYSGTDFEPVVREEKDCFGRFIVRGEEIIRSSRMVEEISRPSARGSEKIESNQSGQGAARVESPQGDLFYYVRLEEGHIADIGMVSPSRLNITAFENSMIGNIFTDFHFNWESFGIWVSEAGVEMV